MIDTLKRTDQETCYLEMLAFIEKAGYEKEGLRYGFVSILNVLKLLDSELEDQGYEETYAARYELVKLIEKGETFI